MQQIHRTRTGLLLVASVGVIGLLAWIFGSAGSTTRSIGPLALPPSIDVAAGEVQASEAAPHGARRSGAPGERSALAFGEVGLAEPQLDDGSFEADAVYGTVVDPDLVGVGGARCLLLDPVVGRFEDVLPLAQSRSDAQGRFRFRHQSALQPYEVYVDHPDFVPAREGLLSGQHKRVSLARAQEISGRVLESDGRPAALVRLSLSRAAFDGARFRKSVDVLSDAEGRYRLPCAPLGEIVRLRAYAPGRAPEAREFQVVEGVRDGYDLRLSSGKELVLELVDAESGAALGDVLVTLYDGLDLRTDSQGRIRLRIAESPADRRDPALALQVKCAGWCTTHVQLEAIEGGAVRTVRVPLERGGRIRGQVVAANGTPVPGARVHLGWRNEARPMVLGQAGPVGGGGRAPGLPGQPGVSFANASQVELSDADGRFQFAGVLPRTAPLQLHVTHPAFLAAQPVDVDVTSRAAEPETTITLEQGATLSGTVRINGRASGGFVSWSTEEKGETVPSNDQGAYRVSGLPSGVVSVWATEQREGWNNEGASSAQENLEVAPDAALVHDFDLVSQRLAIAGRLRRRSGEGVVGAYVSAWSEIGEDEEIEAYAESTTGTDGAFTLEVEARAGIVYTLSAGEENSWTSLSGVAPGSAGIELVLPDLGWVGLEVGDAQTGSPLRRFQLWWRSSESDGFQRYSGSSAPGPDGFFHASLPLGTVDVRVSARNLGYPAGGFDNVAVLAERPRRGAANAVTIGLSRGVTLEVRFQLQGEAGNEPWRQLRRGALRLLRPQDEHLREDSDYFWSEIGFALRPDTSGLAMIGAVPAGTYRLESDRADLSFEPTEFEVPAVDRHAVEIRWSLKPKDDGAGAPP
jgi:hypothetical protein